METSLQTTNQLKLLLKHGLMDRRENSFFQGINSLAEIWQKCIDVVGDCIEKCHYVWKFVVRFYIQVAKLFERPSYHCHWYWFYRCYVQNKLHAALAIDDLQSQLCRHLLKTICTDIVNTVFSIYGTEAMMSLPDTKDFTAEVGYLIVFYSHKSVNFYSCIAVNFNGASEDANLLISPHYRFLT